MYSSQYVGATTKVTKKTTVTVNVNSTPYTTVAATRMMPRRFTEPAHHKRTVGGALQRMRTRKLSAAFEKWQATAAQMKAEQMALRRAVMKMVAAKLSAAWATWRQSASSCAHFQRLLRQAAMRMVHRSLGASLLGWREAAADMKRTCLPT